MKMLCRLMIATLWLLEISLVSCSSSNSLELPDEVDEQSVQLDHDLRVLFLGNSYSVDATEYLDELVSAAKINKNQLGIYNGVINGGGFADWIDRYHSKSTVSVSRVTGNIEMEHKQSLDNI